MSRWHTLLPRIRFTGRSEASIKSWEAGLISSEDDREEEVFGEKSWEYKLREICMSHYNDDFSWLPALREFYQQGVLEQESLKTIKEMFLRALK